MSGGRINTRTEKGWHCFVIDKWSLKNKQEKLTRSDVSRCGAIATQAVKSCFRCVAYLTGSVRVALCVLHYSREYLILVSARIKIPDLIGLIIQFSMS